MYICSNGHEEIVHEEGTKSCPLCSVISERDDAIQQLEQSEKEIVHLEGKIEMLELERGGTLEQ